jgi:hypothetical protein
MGSSALISFSVMHEASSCREYSLMHPITTLVLSFHLWVGGIATWMGILLLLQRHQHHVECYRSRTAHTDSESQHCCHTHRPWTDHCAGRVAVLHSWDPALARAGLHSMAVERTGWQRRCCIYCLHFVCHRTNSNYDQCCEQGSWANRT